MKRPEWQWTQGSTWYLRPSCGKPLELGPRLRDLVGERSEGPILPVAELEAAGAVVRRGGEDRLGVRAVSVGERRADHRNRHSRGARRLRRSRQSHLRILGSHVAARPEREVEAVETRVLRRCTCLGDRQVGQVVGEQDELHQGGLPVGIEGVVCLRLGSKHKTFQRRAASFVRIGPLKMKRGSGFRSNDTPDYSARDEFASRARIVQWAE